MCCNENVINILMFLLFLCVLVQPFMSRTSWGFPKRKVNKDESAFDCAIREVGMDSWQNKAALLCLLGDRDRGNM